MKLRSLIFLLGMILFMGPSGFAQLSFDLKEINKSENWFDDLKEAGAAKDNVYYLNLSLHKYETIPEEIYGFKKLKYLDLSYNKITSIDPRIAKLKDLELLNLSGNNFESLPEEITKFKSLKELHLKEHTMTEEAVKQLKKWLPDILIVIH